ncbi:hypothetical protein [Aurantiacibacter suaedae]|uniref:hypothetical protein n=1 Tax=Aurantiacibacter suaedae TaxID=2545755 RepID=UPI0010F9F2CD|nr:hypothetical protein [Aurantiacibacter suaedae]
MSLHRLIAQNPPQSDRHPWARIIVFLMPELIGMILQNDNLSTAIKSYFINRYSSKNKHILLRMEGWEASALPMEDHSASLGTISALANAGAIANFTSQNLSAGKLRSRPSCIVST